MKPVKRNRRGYANIDDYIRSFPRNIQIKLNEMRVLIREESPEAAEKISYQVPTFFFNGNLVHFAAFSNHIGFYPGPSAIAAFQGDLAGFKNAKGSVQFPMHEPLPGTLIRKMVRFRVAENKKKKSKS